jgi:hypothetical protein
MLIEVRSCPQSVQKKVPYTGSDIPPYPFKSSEYNRDVYSKKKQHIVSKHIEFLALVTTGHKKYLTYGMIERDLKKAAYTTVKSEKNV